MDAESNQEDWLDRAGRAKAAEQASVDPLLQALDSAYGDEPQEQSILQVLARVKARLRQEVPVLYYDMLPHSAVGPISVALSDHGLVAVEFGRAGEDFLRRLQQAHRATAMRSPDRAGPVLRQLAEYLAGERQSFEVQVDLSGSTPFQRQVLQAASQVPRGGLATYAEIARHIGKPRASRAVGQALARNPVPIVIPCHRVVAADGALTGYSGGGGIRTKAQLLALEGVSTYAAALS